MKDSLITLTDPRSPAAEAFRTLRTNLIFSSLDRPLTTLLVTSAAPDEGKSVTLANLAVTMAQGGRTRTRRSRWPPDGSHTSHRGTRPPGRRERGSSMQAA